MAAVIPDKKRIKAFASSKALESWKGRTNNMKTAAGRAKKIATLVAMLARGETVIPQQAVRR